MSSSHAIYRPRRTSSPVIFRPTPLRMRRPAHQRSLDVRWLSTDFGRSEDFSLKEEDDGTEDDQRRRQLTRRAYLIEATLRDVKMDQPLITTIAAIGGGGRNKATVLSRHLSDPAKLVTDSEGEGGGWVGRRWSERSPERMTRQSKQVTNRSTSLHRDLLRMKFKFVGKLIIACHKISDEHKFGNQKYEELFPYVRTLHFDDYDDSDAYSNVVTFNPNKYKANKQLRIPEEARRILSKPPHERTQTELLFAKTALLSLKSYAEYPIKMQMKIVAAGKYERYESKRMILRQGHAPTSFYFILSGSVVVMVREAEFPQSIPIGYRGKGDTFGELAMIARTRQASVISKETIELLSLNIQDFQDIFMFGGLKNLTNPDNFEFLRSLEMLKDWPVEQLINLASSKETVFRFFPRGEILVKDSHFLENLVIVKSGSVRVLKKMKQHQPQTQDSKKPIETSRGTGRKADSQRDEDLLFLPPIKTSNEDETGCYVLTEVRVPKRLQDHHADDIVPELPESSHVTAVHRQSLHVVLKRNESGSGCAGDEKNTGRLVEEGRGRLYRMQELPEEDEDRPKDERMKKRTRNDKDREEEKENAKESMGRKQHIRKITEEIESNRSVITDSESEAEVDSNPKFIHIQAIRKGQVFGLANLLLEDQPSLCAVSDGAECIMVNKKLYLRHASDKLIAMLKLTCVPYPSENELNEKLEKSVSWRKYKDRILAKTMNDIIISGNSNSARIHNSRSQLQHRHRRTHSPFTNHL